MKKKQINKEIILSYKDQTTMYLNKDKKKG